MSIELVMLSNRLIFCPLLLFLPSTFSSIRVFSNEQTLHIRLPKYWSFSISPSSKYSGLISFRMDWMDLLAVQRTLQCLLHLGWKKIKMKSLLVDSVLFSTGQIRTSLSSQFITNFLFNKLTLFKVEQNIFKGCLIAIGLPEFRKNL